MAESGCGGDKWGSGVAYTGCGVVEWLGCLLATRQVLGSDLSGGDSLLSSNSEEARQLKSEIPVRIQR